MQSDDSDDGLFDDLEEGLDDDFDLGGFRERRMEELRAQIDTMQKMKETNYGRYTEYKNEKDLISTTAKAKRCLVHFFHTDFRRCKIMDKHLEKLAAKHFDTLFLRANVANVPFLVTKLEIKVLPCVVGFVDGLSKLKIVGFEELEGGDDFSTASLELGLIQSGVIDPNPARGGPGRPSPSGQGTAGRRGIRGASSRREGDDSSDDD
ncbi:thioredoxin-like protein [Leucosporidium creatinivorum]|uniref:Thioredoxin-like protein n=1 Tax=Leucosporidium creatinivorum TaxID=106004 RepID=A0A1Y2ECJ1_9BASI|nr:thioredoxin-like protein [Leucosporidium creatinivorum]